MSADIREQPFLHRDGRIRKPVTLHGHIEPGEWRWVYTFSAVLLALISIPYLVAYGLALPDATFSGVLVNPIDGHSYLAKMQQGYNGSWLFTLPYTAEPHQGIITFTFYLFLGHVARVLDLSIPLVYNVVRTVGALLMFIAAYRFVADWTDDATQRRLTWALIILGSGFGAIAAMFGRITPDLLILPEAFPLQAAYTNAHFPWAIGLTLLLVHVLTRATLSEMAWEPELNGYTIFLAVGTLVVANMQAFLLIPLAFAFAAMCIYLWWKRKTFPLREIRWGLVMLIFGLPYYLYLIWAFSQQNPLFYAWMQQNITPSPPVLNYLIAFGPILAFSIVGIWAMADRFNAGQVFLLGWLVSCLLFLYAPIGLQRRFSMGMIFPIGVFAGIGLWRVIIPELTPRRRVLMIIAVFTLILPTTLVSIILPMAGSVSLQEQQIDNYYFYSKSEIEALQWLQDETADGNSIVLASQPISLQLPQYGHQVVYAHPFETVNATEKRAAVDAFFEEGDCSVLQEQDVGYVFIGPRERALSNNLPACVVDSSPIFVSDDGDVAIYHVPSITVP